MILLCLSKPPARSTAVGDSVPYRGEATVVQPQFCSEEDPPLAASQAEERHCKAMSGSDCCRLCSSGLSRTEATVLPGGETASLGRARPLWPWTGAAQQTEWEGKCREAGVWPEWSPGWTVPEWAWPRCPALSTSRSSDRWSHQSLSSLPS